jgi:flavin-dependent dehydrogenase
MNMPEADLLIVGIGPAGGALAAFAAQYGSRLFNLQYP